MSGQLKYIVQELNKEPFNKRFNLISFDDLASDNLLQVLTDVLGDIDPKQQLDVREESADQTAIRIFNILRILKYRPPTDSDNLVAFREGIVKGEKPVIYPILEWLISKRVELKKRAYLAMYLVKIEVPPDQLQDDDISDLYARYEECMGEFKELHKSVEMLRNSGYSTVELKKDIASMEDEKEQVTRRIDRLKRKIESQPNNGPMLTVARSLRMERDRESKLSSQKQDQRNSLSHAEQRYQRLQNQLKDMRQASVGATPEGLMERLDEETRINTYMVQEKLPKDLIVKRKSLQDLERVVNTPAMGHSDLDQLNNEIKTLNTEINQLIEKRMMSNDPIDDKLSLFRQQASIIQRKKEAAAESLREARDDLSRSEQEINEKRELVSQGDGEEVLKGDEFKKYVNKLRGKSNVYKKKRQELAELRAELGVLSRTEEILRQKDDQINQQLSSLESKKGVSGYRDTQEELEKVSSVKSELDDMKGKTLEDISEMVRKLTGTIADKKSALAPIIKELRPLRQNCQELTQEHDDKKIVYDTTSAGLESNRAKLEQEVKGYREECSGEESRFHYLSSMKTILEVQQQKINDEMKAYTSHDPSEKKRSFREQYTKKIQEQENLGKSLREKQKMVRESHGPSMKQMKMWKDFEKLMACKIHCNETGGVSSFNSNAMRFTDTSPAPGQEDQLYL